MSLKGWLLTKVHGSSGRPGGSRVAPSLRGDVASTLEVAEHGRDDADASRTAQRHLGPYAPLVAAIRDELDGFAESQLRLHLAIAERDRYVLTSIEVASDADDGHAALLKRFMAEFTPEQIKRFLARDLIAGLRNASAIDLSQFAGLNVDAAPSTNDDPYQALIADLKSGTPDGAGRAYEVALVGRWVQTDAPTPGGAPGRPRADGRGTNPALTPLAARIATLAIDDARGARRVELAPVIPGRRYVVGKDENCDVVVDGVYVSRRHCEIWFDAAGWWVADAGSTNGIRVESGAAVARSGPPGPGVALELPAGALLVLSAQARGETREYPTVRWHPMPAAQVPTQVTGTSDRATPATPLAPARRGDPLLLAARMASGVKEIDLGASPLPFGIGRSRNQSLVVDPAHADVSGRHVEIVAVEEAGVSVVVHGDNGVTVDGVVHPAGARFLWKRGETMLLGRADANAPACSVSLMRDA